MKINQRAEGFSLIEVTLAIGVAAISLITIFGLLITGSQTNHTAVEQSSSADILTALVADLRSTPRTSPTSSQFGISIPGGGNFYFDSQGQFSTSQNSNSRYRATISFLSNNGGTRTASFARLRVTWPAASDPNTANTGSVETFLALDRN